MHPNRVACINKLPDWNAEVESLVLRFQGNRVLSSSSKNFLLYEERKLKMAADEASTMRGKLASESVDGEDSDSGTASNTGTGASAASVQTDDMRSVYSGASYDNDSRPDDLATTPISADNAILQFGKVSENRFIMDFKYPLSPLQSLASACVPLPRMLLSYPAAQGCRQPPSQLRAARGRGPIWEDARGDRMRNRYQVFLPLQLWFG